MHVGDLTIFFLLEWVFTICSPGLFTVKKSANECSVLCLLKKEKKKKEREIEALSATKVFLFSSKLGCSKNGSIESFILSCSWDLVL